MTSLGHRDDAPAATRTLGGAVGAGVGALVAFPLLLAGIGPIGLAVPVGLILGWWLAPSAAAADRLPLGTIAAMALAAVVLGDALMAIGTVIALPALAPDGSPVRSDHTCL